MVAILREGSNYPLSRVNPIHNYMYCFLSYFSLGTSLYSSLVVLI